MKQKTFNYSITSNSDVENFFVSKSNKQAYEFSLSNNINAKYSILYGAPKSGKTHLGLIWQKKNEAIKFHNNYDYIINKKKNIFYDDFLNELDEEKLFHLINHCFNNNLKILLCTDTFLYDYKFRLNDLLSRLKSFNFIKILDPDDDLIVNLIIKLLSDRQIIINNPKIISYILKRINRTYNDIFVLIEKIDQLSLEQKRELTIPLLRELI